MGSKLAGLTLILGMASAVGCQVSAQTGKGAATVIGKGIVNDPANKSLRFDMLKFGLDQFCKRLLVTGAPLRLNDDQPVIGRFFANSCRAESIDEKNENSIIVQFEGHGYAWTLGTGRLGFRARGLLELAPDFRVHEDAMYVYFRPIQVDTSDFEVLMSERQLARAAAQVAGVGQRQIGKAIIDAQLGRGFTVVRFDEDGHTDFALGLIPEGQAPFRPYRVVSSPKRTLANGRTEIFVGQQDYLGRIRVEGEQVVSITLALEGTPFIDVALIPASSGSTVVEEYVTEPGPKAPAGRLPFSTQVSEAAPLKAEVSVPPGDYFLLLDHSEAFGRSYPTENALPARVDYLIQVGRALAESRG